MYCCLYPKCDFTTSKRREIDYHHIIPKELNGSNNASNRMWVCPNHHRLIFVPGTTNGHHSIKSKNSIIIKKFLQSTNGIVLSYIDCEDNKEYLYMYKTKDILPI